jgi:hypothetical protein
MRLEAGEGGSEPSAHMIDIKKSRYTRRRRFFRPEFAQSGHLRCGRWSCIGMRPESVSTGALAIGGFHS